MQKIKSQEKTGNCNKKVIQRNEQLRLFGVLIILFSLWHILLYSAESFSNPWAVIAPKRANTFRPSSMFHMAITYFLFGKVGGHINALFHERIFHNLAVLAAIDLFGIR